MRAYWKEQAARISRRIDAHKALVGKTMPTTLRKDSGVEQLDLGAEFWDDEDELFRATLIDFFTEASRDSIAVEDAWTQKQFGLMLDPTLTNAEAAKWARTYGAKLVTKINQTTRAAIKESVANWIETPNATLGDLMDDLPFGEVRAQLIAVTETTNAYMQGELLYTQDLRAQYPDLDIVRIWNTNNDDRVCEMCGPLNGQEIDDDQDGSLHPGCRCWTSRTVRTEK